MQDDPVDNPSATLPPPGNSPAQGPERKFVVFALGNDHFAIDASAVSEVVRDLNTTFLPNLPDWLVGIANLRGEIVTVIEPEKLMGAPTRTSLLSPKHIVMRNEAMDAIVAFSVDKLREVVTVSESAVEPADDEENPFLTGAFAHKSGPVKVFDAELLLQSLSLD